MLGIGYGPHVNKVGPFLRKSFLIDRILTNSVRGGVIIKQAQLRLCKLGLGTLFKGSLKLSVFVVQKAAAPKTGVIESSYIVRRRATSPKVF